MSIKILLVIYLVFFVISIRAAFCQMKQKPIEHQRNFQLSLFPGVSTNGIQSGTYKNHFSLNVFSGISSGNKMLEIGGISNSSFKSVTGIQLAGFANVIGANSFVNLSPSEERTAIQDESFEASCKGIQMAGFLNYIRNSSTGFQLGGVANIVRDNSTGIQLGGISNRTGGALWGVQLAGLQNIAEESVGGLQISAIFNRTDGELSGLQVALFNKAQSSKGKKSTPPTSARGFQVGLLNFNESMDGLQIGIINFGGSSRGKQIGIINFFEKNPSKENVRMGTPIGLLNFGSRGSIFRLYYDELFLTNIEYTTGNCLNCTYTIPSGMPYHDKNKIFNQNALILGFDRDQNTFGFGYGFQKVLLNKSGPARQLTYGIKFIHLNRTMSIDKNFNLVSRLNFDYSKPFRYFKLFVGISINYFLYDPEGEYKIKTVRIPTGKVSNLNSEIWPGYTIGIQF